MTAMEISAPREHTTAQRKFGTPRAANAPRPVPVSNGSGPKSMMGMDDGMMGDMPHADGPDPD